MNELGDVWAAMLAEAAAKARASGRHDVADYLALKAANDMVRTAGVRWLFDSLIEVATSPQGKAPIKIERDDPFSFPYRGANMVGSRLVLRYGVRCLTAEAGWTRTPADGFMRGGALAVARLNHFGMPKQNAELLLVGGAGAPVWELSVEDAKRRGFNFEDLRRHFDLFLGI